MYQITLISSTVGNDRFLMKSKRKKTQRQKWHETSDVGDYWMLHDLFSKSSTDVENVKMKKNKKKYITISRNALNKKKCLF